MKLCVPGYRISPLNLRFRDDGVGSLIGEGFVTGDAEWIVRAANASDRWTDRLLVFAAALTAAVSGALFVSLILRGSASLNALNIVTLLGSSALVLAALYFSRNFTLLLISYVAFVVTVAPSAAAWIAFLYGPPFVALSMVIFITLIRRFAR
jgi:hypothetical protein